MLVSSVQGAEIAQTIAKTTAATPAAEAVASSKPYYFSPALVIDPKSGTDVLEYRNTSTGTVINQYPSEKDIKAYAQTNAAKEVAAIATPPESTPKTDATAAKPVITDTDSQPAQAVLQTAVVI